MNSNLFFLENKNTKCDYAVIRLNNKFKKNTRILKSSQSYLRSEKDYISIEEIIENSSSKLCGGINKDYIIDSLDENDIVILSLSLKNRNTRSKISAKKLCGLIFLKVKPTYIFVSLVCGLPGLGKKLLNIIEKIAKLHGAKKIKLDSVDNACNFYLKNGFTFDRGREVHVLGDDEIERHPKKISKIPPNKINNKIIDIGYIHSETHGKYKYQWVLVVENGLKRWKFIKKSYIQINKFNPEIRKKILTRKPNLISIKDLKKKGKSKKYLNNGIITTLRNVNTTLYEEDINIKMSKKL